MTNNTQKTREDILRGADLNHTEIMKQGSVYYQEMDYFICVESNCKEMLSSSAHYHCSECPFVFSTKERAMNYLYHPHSLNTSHVKGE